MSSPPPPCPRVVQTALFLQSSSASLSFASVSVSDQHLELVREGSSAYKQAVAAVQEDKFQHAISAQYGPVYNTKGERSAREYDRLKTIVPHQVALTSCVLTGQKFNPTKNKAVATAPMTKHLQHHYNYRLSTGQLEQLNEEIRSVWVWKQVEVDLQQRASSMRKLALLDHQHQRTFLISLRWDVQEGWDQITVTVREYDVSEQQHIEEEDVEQMADKIMQDLSPTSQRLLLAALLERVGRQLKSRSDRPSSAGYDYDSDSNSDCSTSADTLVLPPQGWTTTKPGTGQKSTSRRL